MSIVSVVGAGYVGLVTGSCLAELGHYVVCVEIDRDRVSALERGELPIHEPGLNELLTRQLHAGRLFFTSDYAAAIPESEFVFIAVHTPSRPDGHAETGFVFAAVTAILEHARPGLTIVTKSTVPVGTGDAIAELVERSGLQGVEVVSNPEFLREGSAIQDFLEPPRIVVGAAHPSAGATVAGLYAALDAPVFVCSRRSAELAKYTANALLASRISFMNEVATICDAVGADIQDVTRIVGADPRIGPAFLGAGLGWGGSCFPKDVCALAATAVSHGCCPAILDAVRDVNARQRQRAVQYLRSAVGRTAGATVGVLGLAFKPGTDDIREAPALHIIRQLRESGIGVRAHDPVAMDKARLVLPDVEYCDDAYEVAVGSDALLLATEWHEYTNLIWPKIRSLMRRPIVVDGRNALDGKRLSELGFTYLAFGRPTVGAADQVPGSDHWTDQRVLDAV